MVMLQPEKSYATTKTTTITRSATKERNQIQFRRTHRLPSRRSSLTVATSSHAVPELSRTTGLVFQAILGAAACLALVGVVAASQEVQNPAPVVNSGSPEAPPPAVFVHFN
jgi:hypothetical protein